MQHDINRRHLGLLCEVAAAPTVFFMSDLERGPDTRAVPVTQPPEATAPMAASRSLASTCSYLPYQKEHDTQPPPCHEECLRVCCDCLGCFGVCGDCPCLLFTGLFSMLLANCLGAILVGGCAACITVCQ